MKLSIILAMFMYKIIGTSVEIATTQNLPIITSDQIICSFCVTNLRKDVSYETTPFANPANGIKEKCNSSYDIKNKNEYLCGFQILRRRMKKDDVSINHYEIQQLAIKKIDCLKSKQIRIKRDMVCTQSDCFGVIKCCNGNLCNSINNLYIKILTQYHNKIISEKNTTLAADDSRLFTEKKCISVARPKDLPCILVKYKAKEYSANIPICQVSTDKTPIITTQKVIATPKINISTDFFENKTSDYLTKNNSTRCNCNLVCNITSLAIPECTTLASDKNDKHKYNNATNSASSYFIIPLQAFIIYVYKLLNENL